MLRACAAVSGKGHSFTWQQSGGLGGSATATIRSAELTLVNYSDRHSIGEFRRATFVPDRVRACENTSPCRSRPYHRVRQDGESLAFQEVRKHGVRGGSQVLQHLPHEEIGFQHLVHLSNQCARSAFTLRNVALARCFAIQLLHLLAEPVDPADLRLDLGLQAGEVNIQALGIERELVIVVNHAVDCSG
jgi:hypothetical protein